MGAKRRSLAPGSLARAIVTELRRAADPGYAAGARRFFRASDQFAIIGARTPAVRRIAREAHRMVRDRWALSDAVACASSLAERPELDAKVAGFVLLGRFRKHFVPSVATTARRWIVAGHCPNWAAIDSLSSEVLGPLIATHPATATGIAAWHRSPNLWLRRAAIVPFVLHARRGAHLETVYATITRLLDDPEDLMHKACGWVLREAGKADRERLERFIAERGPDMPRTTLRYAIERFPPARRRALLNETRRVRSA